MTTIVGAALLSCDPSRLVPDDGIERAFTLQMGNGDTTPRAIDPQTSDIALCFGIKGHQSGALVAGHSDIDNQTVAFRLSTFAPDGETVLGYGGESEVFTVPDPSVIASSLPDGSTVSGMYGTFMARMSGLNPTDIRAEEDIDGWNAIGGDLTEINEVVLRTSLGDVDVDGATLLFAPHFVITADDAWATYSHSDGTLSVNSGADYLADLEYVLMLPASIVGAGFSYLIPASVNAVANPVLGNDVEGSDPASWTLNPDWIYDEAGNAGIFAMIDSIAGLSSPENRYADQNWVALASYFHRFFAKYYKSASIMFDSYSNVPNGNSSFLVLALDDTDGALELDADSVLSVSYAPEGSTFELVSDALEVTGTPPLSFTARVVNSP